MTAPNTIRQLVEHFQQNHESFRSGKYNEAQLRQEFLNPFFEALGWDMINKQGYAEAYKDVIHEASLDIEGATKAPDYAFRIGGTRKFFVEAKKPAVNIQYDIHPAFQVRRYAWSAKLSLSILTDFEEFAVYDCRSKPNRDDKAATGRVMFLKYDQYVERWDEIAAIFSRDAVLKGSFDKYAQGVKGKRGTLEVDDAFLKEIEHWRNLLARNLALRNIDLNVHELNYAVQMIINRILFLRICEDRGIEREGLLQESLDGGQSYENLCQLFRQADSRYNSGLFHFAKEKEQSSNPDDLTLQLEIDDKVLKEIISALYYPGPYVFREIPADIMGQVYERFLGKIIRLTAGHQAKVEDKPEVRKAGGVYYTPTYIVDYIVKNTVGKLLEGKMPKEAASLRILDPACGSGSFLLGAYQYLLDWHLKWYGEHHPEKLARAKAPVIYQAGSAEWRLTTTEKKRILQNNIYGVDIDAQAVEVTKLSLLLKVLEGESQESIGSQLELFKERALPNLGKNIRCGNSLIGPDFYAQQQISMFDMDEDDRYRINVFDWDAEFKEIMSAGGFDAVIGNPPYIRIQAMKEWAPLEVEFYKKKYKSASKGNYDIYVVFVEKGLSLLNKKGEMGFILPHKFFNAKYGGPLRKLIAEGKHLSQVVHFGDQQVFKNATTYTCVLVLSRRSLPSFLYHIAHKIEEWKLDKSSKFGKIKSEKVSEGEWNFVIGKGSKLFNKLQENYKMLGEISDIYVGIQTSADKVFIMDCIAETTRTVSLFSKSLKKEVCLEKQIAKPIISGTDVSRYSTLNTRQYVLFPYLIRNNSFEIIRFEEIQKNNPNTANYFYENKHILENREKGKMKGKEWYGYVYKKNMTKQFIEKLCVPRLVENLYATIDHGNFILDNVDVGGIILKQNYENQGLLFQLGLINSKLLRWFFPFVSAPFRGGWMSANRQFLSQLPICTIDFYNPAEVAQHDKMVSLVEDMLELNKNLAVAQTPQEQQSLQRQIGATDKQIDSLVYELYNLTEEEIGIVEGGVG